MVTQQGIYNNEYAISELISKHVLKGTEKDNHISKLCDHYFTDEFGSGKNYTAGESIEVPMPVYGQAFTGRYGKAAPKKIKLSKIVFTENSLIGYMRNIGSYEAAMLTKDPAMAQRFASEIADGVSAIDFGIQQKILDLLQRDISACLISSTFNGFYNKDFFDGEVFHYAHAFCAEYGLSAGEYTLLVPPKIMAMLKSKLIKVNLFEEPLNKDLIKDSKCGRIGGFDLLQVNGIEDFVTSIEGGSFFNVTGIDVESNNTGVLTGKSSIDGKLKKGQVLVLKTIDDEEVNALRATDKKDSGKKFTCVVQEDVIVKTATDAAVKVSAVPIPNSSTSSNVWEYNEARNITSSVPASNTHVYKFLIMGTYTPIYAIKAKSSIKFINPNLPPLTKGLVSYSKRSSISNISLRVSMQDSIEASKNSDNAGIEASTLRLTTLADGLVSNISSFLIPIAPKTVNTNNVKSSNGKKGS